MLQETVLCQYSTKPCNASLYVHTTIRAHHYTCTRRCTCTPPYVHTTLRAHHITCTPLYVHTTLRAHHITCTHRCTCTPHYVHTTVRALTDGCVISRMLWFGTSPLSVIPTTSNLLSFGRTDPRTVPYPVMGGNLQCCTIVGVQ